MINENTYLIKNAYIYKSCKFVISYHNSYFLKLILNKYIQCKYIIMKIDIDI